MQIYHIAVSTWLCRQIHLLDKTNVFENNKAKLKASPQYVDVVWCNQPGAVSIRKTVLPGMAIPMLKIRRPNGRLIFNMEIAIRR